MATRTLRSWVHQADTSPEIIHAYDFSNRRIFLDPHQYPFASLGDVSEDAITDGEGNPITDGSGDAILDR
jgi:hypothetical protein